MSERDDQRGGPDGGEPVWLGLGRELRSIAQIGLTFCRDPFDRQRYERIQELAAQVIAQGSGRRDHALLDYMRHDTGYATPKVDVRGAAFLEGRVLLVREVSDGAWTLPGGWADVNESPRASVCREVFEESGFEVRAVKLAAIHDFRKRNRPHHLDSIYKLIFLCEITGGKPVSSLETSEVAFFAGEALPPLSTGRTTAEQVHCMFRHASHPLLPTEFD